MRNLRVSRRSPVLDAGTLERLLRSVEVIGPQLASVPSREEIPAELGIGEARLLWVLEQAAVPPAVGEMAAALGLPLPRTSQILGDLEARGLVERERAPGDRRRVTVRISAPGRRLVAVLRRAQRQRVERLLAVLGPRDAEQLVGIFERAAQRLEPGATSAGES
jgi:MarR family transcriptional regulator, transcriptional regulator for hemolysin